MSLVEIHDKLAAQFGSRMAVAFAHDEWTNIVRNTVTGAVGSFSLTDLPTIYSGLVYDVTVDADPALLIVNVKSPTEIEVGPIDLQITLRADGVGAGYISRYEARITKLSAQLAVTNGVVGLEPTSNSVYTSTPPDTSNIDRQVHLDALAQIWDPAKMDYFIHQVEPGLGYMVVQGFVTDTLADMSIFDLGKLFPGLAFKGSFTVTQLVAATNEKLVCFAPDSFTKVSPSTCAVEGVETHIVSHVTPFAPNDTEGKMSFLTSGKNHRREYEAKPVKPNTGKVYGYMSEATLKQIFSPEVTVIKDNTMTLVDDHGKKRVGPFIVKYGFTVTFRSLLDLGVSLDGPIVHVRALFDSYSTLDIDLKIGKFTTDIASANAEVSYDIDYDGTLYSDPANGNLGFVGEFYDPTNLDYKTGLNTPLPGVIDKVGTWFLNVICKPLVRGFVTALLVSVTWPFMSRFAVPSTTSGWDQFLRLSGYYSPDKKSMTVAIDFRPAIDG